MSPLQWALLIFGIGIVCWLVYSSWLDKKAVQRSQRPVDDKQRPRFGQDWDDAAERKAARDFDEFGVSKPRRRGEGEEPEAPVKPRTAPAVAARPAATQAPAAAPAPIPPARAPAHKPDRAAPVASKIIAFYIAEHEGTAILGHRLHDALEARGLKFGAKKIYHRLSNGQAVFSIASLTKPGTLDPAQADGFSTPGLSVFMQLPVSIPALAAFEDMLDTARALARDLNAELYDSEKQGLLTPERERELHAQVQDWARQHTGG